LRERPGIDIRACASGSVCLNPSRELAKLLLKCLVGILAPRISRNPCARRIVRGQRMVGVVIDRANNDGPRTRQDSSRIHAPRLLSLEVMHLSRVAAIQPFWIKVALRSRFDARDSRQSESQRL